MRQYKILARLYGQKVPGVFYILSRSLALAEELFLQRYPGAEIIKVGLEQDNPVTVAFSYKGE